MLPTLIGNRQSLQWATDRIKKNCFPPQIAHSKPSLKDWYWTLKKKKKWTIDTFRNLCKFINTIRLPTFIIFHQIPYNLFQMLEHVPFGESPSWAKAYNVGNKQFKSGARKHQQFLPWQHIYFLIRLGPGALRMWPPSLHTLWSEWTLLQVGLSLAFITNGMFVIGCEINESFYK